MYRCISIRNYCLCFQIDTIDPVPGVTVLEGDRIMCGAKNLPQKGMHLVRPLEPHKHSSTQQTLITKISLK